MSEALGSQSVNRRHIGLTNNQLKIIAMFAMLLDHIGLELLPSVGILRIVGRISFPIFAFMIAEGCRYTKNRLKYFLGIFILGAICQTVYYVAMKSLYQNILIGFSVAILAIFSVDLFVRKRSLRNAIIATFGVALCAFVAIAMPLIFKKQGFRLDYGIYAVILPIIVYYMPSKWWKVGAIAAVLIYRAFDLGGVHWYTLISVALLALYNGERGRLRLKYAFYIFYPLHLVVIYLISMLI